MQIRMTAMVLCLRQRDPSSLHIVLAPRCYVVERFGFRTRSINTKPGLREQEGEKKRAKSGSGGD